MALRLAKDEKIIKEYNYATTTEGIIEKRITDSFLMLTNKRIIKAEYCRKGGFEKRNLTEIPIGSVTGVNASMTSSYRFGFLILGIIFGIVGMICLVTLTNDDFSYLFGMLCAWVLAGVCFYRFVKTRRNTLNCTFTVADRVNSAMFIGKTSFSGILSLLHISGPSVLLKVDVNADVAKNLVDEIGAIIIEIKENP